MWNFLEASSQKVHIAGYLALTLSTMLILQEQLQAIILCEWPPQESTTPWRKGTTTIRTVHRCCARFARGNAISENKPRLERPRPDTAEDFVVLDIFREDPEGNIYSPGMRLCCSQPPMLSRL
ncbi:hypothetical protein RB195_000683 [Necator americanus]|uniref:Uncharacterized protein n=1 Tax=Necator americanus TaxID=51031 RepID=A0ABR1DAW2_NECAM